MKPVYGVGVNDSTYHVTRKLPDGEWRCPFYKTWKNMLARCYSQSYLKQCPARLGSSVHPDWLSFMSFRSWMVCQDWEGNILDKDLLVPGNMNYGPDTCLFVTPQVNTFVSNRKSRGVYPNGSGWRAVASMFNSQSVTIVKSKTYRNREDAEDEFRKMYSSSLESLAYIQKNPKVAEALLILSENPNSPKI